jgi:hypothetical protein
LVIPWTINEFTEAELKLVLRFHSFGIDAKSEMIHCIYQELAIALGSEIEELRNYQVIPRIAFSESTPIEVIDVVISENRGISQTKIYVHFTGNAAGGIKKVSFGGINAIVMAGPNIIELEYKKAGQQQIHWASLHESELINTRYILHLLESGGTRLTDILSVIFAKPEQRTKKMISIVTERKVNARRALMQERCTIIFTTSQALNQFIQQFRCTRGWRGYPQIQIGFSEENVGTAPIQLMEQQDHMTLNQFKVAYKIFHYLSNERSSKHMELLDAKIQTAVGTLVCIENRCQIALNTLKQGRDELGDGFSVILNELCREMNLQGKESDAETRKRALAAMNQTENTQSGRTSTKSDRQLRNQPVDMETEVK